MLRQEIRKLFIKRHILLIVGIFLLIKIIITVFTIPTSVYTDKMQQEKYQSYIQFLSGRLTDEKVHFIEQEKEKYADSRQRTESLTSDFSSGKISDEEYDLLMGKETIYRVNEPVFKDIEKQYHYIKADPNKRYFLDCSGWNTLLANEKMDFLLVFCVLIVTSIIFNCESESGMSILNLTCKYGRIRMAGAKIGIGVVMAAIISLLFTLTTIIAVFITTGLSAGGYPLQSLQSFATFSGSLSLLDTLTAVSAFRVLGCCYAAAIIMCVSAFSHSTLITLFAGLSLCTIPYLLPLSSKVKFLLPFPGGLMVGTGYFQGPVRKTVDGAQVLVDPGITSVERLAFLLILSALLVALLFLTAYRYVSKWKGGGEYAD